MIPRVVQVCDAAWNMGYTRETIIEAAELMDSAVSAMKEVMRLAGKSDIYRADRMKIDSDIFLLQEECPALAESLMDAALLFRDEWPEIEMNRLRMAEMSRFLEKYQRLRMTVLEFDDWRCDCYDGIEIYPKAHEIAMSMVILCNSADEELRLVSDALAQGSDDHQSIDSMLEQFEKEMEPFCKIPNKGYLVNQIVRTVDPVFPAIWTGQKNELTYFAEWFRKDASQIRKIFEFEDDKKTKTPYELSKYPASTLPRDNALVKLLERYPKDNFFK